MSKKLKPKRRPHSANRPTEGRIVTDPAAALPKLRKMKEHFDRAHADGMAALIAGDYTKLGDAIARERRVIGEQNAVIKQAQKEHTKERQQQPNVRKAKPTKKR